MTFVLPKGIPAQVLEVKTCRPSTSRMAAKFAASSSRNRVRMTERDARGGVEIV